MCIALPGLEPADLALLGGEGDLGAFAEALDTRVLLTHRVVVGRHELPRRPKSIGHVQSPLRLLIATICTRRVHTKRYARSLHPIGLNGRGELLNGAILGEGRLVEGGGELVEPQVLLGSLTPGNALLDCKVLFFNTAFVFF